MSYIFMKILEQRPESYDAGISRISGEDWRAVRERIMEGLNPGERVLEIGCGPGALSVEMARRGARVTALDINPGMLLFARGLAAEAKVEIDFKALSAERLNELEGKWDLIIASLSFSELRPVVRDAVLSRVRLLLSEKGRVVVVDEVMPESGWARLRYRVSRLLWGLLAWARTRKGTTPLSGFDTVLSQQGYEVKRQELFPGGNLKLWEARPLSGFRVPEPETLKGGWGLSDWLENFLIWLTSHFIKIPVRPGLYKIGSPSPESPLLATSNCSLTVNMVRKYLRGRDAWLLVNDTRGVNVWCSAGEGNFSASEIAITLSASHAEKRVNGRDIILPKLCLNGVKLQDLKAFSGFKGIIGPVYARDLPAYLDSGLKKTPAMERIDFNFLNRLWFGVPFAILMSLITGVLALVFHGRLSPYLPLWFAVICMLVSATYTWLPTRRHLVKGLTLGAIIGAGMVIYLFLKGEPAIIMTRSGVLFLLLGLFVTADFSGVTPVSNRTLVEREFKTIYLLLTVLLTVYLGLAFWK